MARRKGSIRLIDVGYGSRQNKFGVRFTATEMKRFRNEVQRVNRRLKSYTEQMQRIREQGGIGIDSRIPVEPLFQKKSTSLQRFKTKEEFNDYLARARRQGSSNYIKYRHRTEVENFKESIRKEFSQQEARTLISKVNKINEEDIHNAFVSRRLEHTGYVYHDPERTKFNTLLSQLEALA